MGPSYNTKYSGWDLIFGFDCSFVSSSKSVFLPLFDQGCLNFCRPQTGQSQSQTRPLKPFLRSTNIILAWTSSSGVCFINMRKNSYYMWLPHAFFAESRWAWTEPTLATWNVILSFDGLETRSWYHEPITGADRSTKRETIRRERVFELLTSL